MKRFYFITILFNNFLFLSKAQVPVFADTAAIYFEEVKQATRQHISLWNKDIYAPVLLVNPSTREVFCNAADTGSLLKKAGSIYTGILPKNINISNTAINWGGKSWAMVMLPLSKNKQNRINLLTHELFHRAQKDLGFIAYNPDNNHLDKKEGRIYLRLELEALQKALLEVKNSRVKKHLQNALLFRQMRRILFATADSTENLMELNEGICEYTGQFLSGRTKEETIENFKKRIAYFISTASYVRSFAYETIPLYGYLLNKFQNNWHQSINAKTNLTNYFTTAFGIKLPDSINNVVAKRMNLYNGVAIVEEETTREQSLMKQLAVYRTIFLEKPHLDIPLIKMNMSFDYTKIVSLENNGTVYPQIRITDNWGILEVTMGALISPDWKKISVSKPLKTAGNIIEGEGWKLELNELFEMTGNEINGYAIKRK